MLFLSRSGLKAGPFSVWMEKTYRPLTRRMNTDKLRAEGKKYIAPEEENMKALFIGGTGTISMAIVRKLAEDPQWEVWLLNRGRRKAEMPDGIHQITADIHDEAAAAKALEGLQFDTVCEFIAFHPDDAERSG